MLATVSAEEAAANFAELLSRVTAAEEVVIAREGRPVARLAPVESFIMIQSGKLRIPEEPEDFIAKRLALHSMDSLSVKLEHAPRVKTRPTYHKDPFDRMLVAQALSEELPIITADQIARYPVDVIG
jgi:prevent-host-death family protein